MAALHSTDLVLGKTLQEEAGQSFVTVESAIVGADLDHGAVGTLGSRLHPARGKKCGGKAGGGSSHAGDPTKTNQSRAPHVER